MSEQFDLFEETQDCTTLVTLVSRALDTLKANNNFVVPFDNCTQGFKPGELNAFIAGTSGLGKSYVTEAMMYANTATTASNIQINLNNNWLEEIRKVVDDMIKQELYSTKSPVSIGWIWDKHNVQYTPSPFSFVDTSSAV